MSFDYQEDVIEQVRNLKFNHELIHHEFQAVRRALQNIGGYAKGARRTECQRMLDDWSCLHQTYLKLLWMSKDIAGYARAAAIDFVDVFAPHVLENTEMNVHTRTQLLQGYIKHLESDTMKSKSLTDGFSDLQRDVECFHDRWKDKIKESGLIHMSSRHRIYEASIAELSTRLKPLRLKLFALKITMIFVTSAKSIIASIDGTRESNRHSALSRALNEAKNEIRNRASSLKGYNAEDPYDPIIADIAAKLGAMASIWSGISADLVVVCGLMIKGAEHTDADAQRLYNPRVSAIRSHYRRLAEVLLEFQVSLEGSPLLRQM